MIKCPTCGHPQSKIVQSYERDEGFYQRRRVCFNCGNGFITREFSTDAIEKLATDNNITATKELIQRFGGR